MSMKRLIDTITKNSRAITGSFGFTMVVYLSIIAGLVLVYVTHVEGHVTFIYNQF